jgi:hypothetical protein
MFSRDGHICFLLTITFFLDQKSILKDYSSPPQILASFIKINNFLIKIFQSNLSSIYVSIDQIFEIQICQLYNQIKISNSFIMLKLTFIYGKQMRSSSIYNSCSRFELTFNFNSCFGSAHL